MGDDRFSRRRLLLNLALSVAILAVFPIVATAYYLPRTYTTVIDETFEEQGSFPFIVKLEYDQKWHVHTRTDQRGTKYNITLLGHPIKSLNNPEDPIVDETTAFMYNWTVRAHEPPISAAYGYRFDIAPWNVWGDEWKLEIQLIGVGELDFKVSSFDRSNYDMFFYIDMLSIFGIVLIIVVHIYRLKWSTS